MLLCLTERGCEGARTGELAAVSRVAAAEVAKAKTKRAIVERRVGEYIAKVRVNRVLLIRVERTLRVRALTSQNLYSKLNES